MFEPFVWMFRYEELKKLWVKMFVLTLGFAFLAVCIYHLLVKYVDIFNIQYAALAAGILFLCPIFYIQGYFWELTEAFVNREFDIESANIYNGRIKEIFRLNLPENRILRLMWRGIASIFATFLLFIPLGLMFYSANINKLEFTVQMFILVFWTVFIPALLWNYARRDSVVAVWNLRKAVYLMGNYPFRYFGKILLLVIWSVITYFILNKLYLWIPQYFIKNILIGFLSIVMYLYNVFVFSYLLGTLAPIQEH